MFKSHCNAFSVKMKGYDKGDRSQGFTLPCNRFVFNFHCTAFSIKVKRCRCGSNVWSRFEVAFQVRDFRSHLKDVFRGFTLHSARIIQSSSLDTYIL